MKQSLITVIMSVYNESLDELEKSINSVLNQSYKNIELIIVDDNPNNKEIRTYLLGISDRRVRLIFNEKNEGLVFSLNRALESASGDYIARMDADDVCYTSRLWDELKFMQINNCDLVGAFVEFIDESDKTIRSILRMPSSDVRIKRYMKWGNCIVHPTWLAKRSVYEVLNGYRNVPHCEDYDFIIRAIISGFTLGNVKKIELKYRIRAKSISRSNSITQFLVRDYLAEKYKKGIYPSQVEINEFLNSSDFQENVELMTKYIEAKRMIKENRENVFVNILIILTSKYLRKEIVEKITAKLRAI